MSSRTPEGIVQGISKNNLKEIICSQGLSSHDFELNKHSELKTLKNITLIKSDRHLDSQEKNKESIAYRQDRKKKKDYSDALDIAFNFPWDIFLINFEIFILILIAVFLILILFIFWAFITIPLILLFLGFLSLGDAWRMLRVYMVQFKPGAIPNLPAIVREIHSQGGIISDNWSRLLSDPGLRKKTRRFRRNYVRFMKSVCLTSYSLFILAVLLTIEHLFSPFGDVYITLFWLLFGTLALIGFAFSMHSLFERSRLKHHGNSR